jgi:hypothetical protein
MQCPFEKEGKMKQALLILLIISIFTAPAYCALSIKGGLAGGAFRVAGVADIRQVNNKLGLSGELGYAVGQSYSILAAGLLGTYLLRDNLSAILTLDYSSYSEMVNLPLLGDIKEKSGIGAGIGIRMMLRKELYAQAALNSRLGAVAEAGYIVRM